MSDIKLFQILPNGVTELPGQGVQIEKSLQSLCENNLEVLLGVKFLASEYSTGKVHGGRIDTLGIDENGCPVIIEYKRAVTENIISQGLFYLDWLLDHRKEFQWLVLESLGKEFADKVEWLGPRLLCIAGDYTKYDQHAVKQINRNIELIRYRRYGNDLLMLDLVNATTATSTTGATFLNQPLTENVLLPQIPKTSSPSTNPYQGISHRLNVSPPALRDLFESIKSYLVSLSDDVQVKQLQYYFAFRRIKNFACIEVFPQAAKLLIYVKVNPEDITVEDGFTRDVRQIGHYGTGDLEITIRTIDDFKKAETLLLQSYEAS